MRRVIPETRNERGKAQLSAPDNKLKGRDFERAMVRNIRTAEDEVLVQMQDKASRVPTATVTLQKAWEKSEAMGVQVSQQEGAYLFTRM